MTVTVNVTVIVTVTVTAQELADGRSKAMMSNTFGQPRQ